MSVGKELQDARKARQLSLAEVTAATKIQPWVLEALETDKLHDQMSTIYARGFLSSYARFLKIPAEPLLAQIQWPGEQATRQTPAQLQVQTELQKQAAVAQSRIQQVVEAAQEPVQTVAAVVVPPKAIAKPVQAKKPQPAPAALKIELPKMEIPWDSIASAIARVAKPLAVTAAIIGIVVINPLRWVPKMSLPKKMASASPVVSAKQAASKRVAFKSQQERVASKPQPEKEQEPLKMASIAPVPVVVQPQPVVVAPQPTPKTELLELTVSATKATWIRVRADGKLVSQQRLERGTKEKWLAKKTLDVVVAKPSQVDITLNGQSINPVAIQHEGRLAITHQGIAKLADDAT